MIYYPRVPLDEDVVNRHLLCGGDHAWGPWMTQRLFAFRERECARCDAVEAKMLPVGKERC